MTPTPHRPRPSAPRALTLVEALVAIVVVAIAAPPMLLAMRDASLRRATPILADRARWLASEKLEDLIADRAGQWFASGRRDEKMLAQALLLLALAPPMDEEYLERRLREETMNRFGLAELRSHHATDQP